MEGLKMFGWTVKFRNDRMGFQKTVTVDAAPNWNVAAVHAEATMEKSGYNSDDLVIIGIERGREVGT